MSDRENKEHLKKIARYSHLTDQLAAFVSDLPHDTVSERVNKMHMSLLLTSISKSRNLMEEEIRDISHTIDLLFMTNSKFDIVLKFARVLVQSCYEDVSC